MSQDEFALKTAIAKIKAICDESEGRSQLFPFGGSGYHASVFHFFDSSTEISYCAVQPGSVGDLQSIIRVIAETRVPFAVKCGGHTSNPGFSSTKGIQIYLIRFNKITVREDEMLVDVGAGCLFGELYRALAPYDLNIVGGSATAGIGISGWLLGGGYSAKTSRLGLGIDNIESAKIVLPDGTFKEVSATQNEELFIAIKGGGNNFGIITEFTLRAHPQGRYYDFQLIYKKKEDFEAVKRAIGTFVKKSDEIDPEIANRANLTPIYWCRNTPEGVEESLTADCVYDGMFPVDDPFQQLREIDHIFDSFGDPLPGTSSDSDDGSAETTPFHVTDTRHSLANETYNLSELPDEWVLVERESDNAQYNVLMCGRTHQITEFVGDGSLVKGSKDACSSRLGPRREVEPPTRPMAGISEFPRGRWGDVAVDTYTPEVIDEVEKEFKEVARHITAHGGRQVAYGMRIYTKHMFDRSSPAAWPHRKGAPNCPVVAAFAWEGKENDAFWVGTMKASLERLRANVCALRPLTKELPYFISAALAEGTRAEDIYRENLAGLGVLKRKYDPQGVMDLAGGFKIPPV